jgi:hypothetical protein
MTRPHQGHHRPGPCPGAGPARRRPEPAFHATDPGLSGTGEWLVTRTPSGVTVARGHGKADVAVRGPAASLLLGLTRRLPPSDPGIEILGEQATAHPLAPAHAILTDPRSKPTAPSQRQMSEFPA